MHPALTARSADVSDPGPPQAVVYGVTRRDACTSAGGRRPWASAGRPPPAPGEGQVGHLPVPVRRVEPARNVRHEAGRAGRDSRAVPADRVRRPRASRCANTCPCSPAARTGGGRADGPQRGREPQYEPDPDRPPRDHRRDGTEGDQPGHPVRPAVLHVGRAPPPRTRPAPAGGAPTRHMCASRTGSGCWRATTGPGRTADSWAPGSTRSARGSAPTASCCSSPAACGRTRSRSPPPGPSSGRTSRSTGSTRGPGFSISSKPSGIEC